MPKPVVLFASVGRTDLQVLLKKNGKHYRCSIQESSVRKFHSAILSGDLPYVIDGSYENILATPDEVEYLWDEGKKQWSVSSGNYKPCTNESGGELILVSPKLAKTVSEFARPKKEWTVVAAIILNTNRSEPDKGSKFKEKNWMAEPFGAGPILSKWLAQKFGLDSGSKPGEIGEKVAGWVNLLDDDMIQPGQGRDYPVNRKAVRRLDEAMKIGASVATEPWICLMIGGGIPNFKEVIGACAAFRFKRNVIFRAIPEIDVSAGGIQSQPSEDSTTVLDSFRFRSHARELIKIGDFAGAFRVVEHLGEVDPRENSWVKKIKIMADYLAGLLTFNERNCPEYLKRVFQKESRMPNCLLAAIRVEAALSIPRIPEAVFWTCNFFDVALGDFISRKVCGGAMINWDSFDAEVEIPSKIEISPSLLKELPRLNPSTASFPNACMVEKGKKANKTSYIISTAFGKDKIWLDQIGSDSLKGFHIALNQKEHGSHGIAPKDLRNGLIHKSLTPQTSAKVKKIFQDANLWNVPVSVPSYKPTDEMGFAEKLAKKVKVRILPGEHFMGVEVVRGIFSELGVDDPAAIYRSLLDGLIGDLEKHEID